MKFSAACLFIVVQSTSAFVPNPLASPHASRLHVVTDPTDVKASNGVEETKKNEIELPAKNGEPTAKTEMAVTKNEESKAGAPAPFLFQEENPNDGALEPGRYSGIDYSITLPFLPRPENLDGSHAGDFGFDPLGLSQEYDLYYMQECELRHARLAMLAVVGWPASEMLAPDFMLQDGCAPSVLNGFNPISAAAVVGMFSVFGVFEYATALRRTWDTPIGRTHTQDMAKIWNNGVAGDYNFDPMGLYSMLGDDADGRKALRQLEIAQGRQAMLGITAFAALEALTGKPIVENNIFFQPNIFLPILSAAYSYASTFFEFSDLSKYPIRIQKSKLGKESDEWLERRADSY